MKKSVIISVLPLWLLLIGSIGSVYGTPRGLLQRPIMQGPQYPLIYMATLFEPDSAFLLPPGEVFVQTSYALLNAWGYSENAYRDDTGVHFRHQDNNGYSVYFDSELDRRFVRLYYGIGKNLELQLTYREIRFLSGSLDGVVENFHRSFQIGNAGRERTGQNLQEIYIHDNRSGQNVFALTHTNDGFHPESITLGLKFLIRETADEALSFSLSSNAADHHIEREINEVDSPERPKHRHFNDWNGAFRYTSLFPRLALHVGFSISFVENSLLEKSPQEIYFYFLGTQWRLSENIDGLFQILEYTSPFPADDVSALHEDVIELTAALRWHIGQQFAFELGMVENQSQGPQNIDIGFFSNLMFHF
jgi:hypothetical protein